MKKIEINENPKVSSNSLLKTLPIESNDNDNTGDSITRLIERESNATRRSIVLLNKNISELLVLLKDKKAKDREWRF